MDQFSYLGDVVMRLHGEFRNLYYLLLPLFFALALILTWFRGAGQGPDFVQVLKRAFVATLLLAAFSEIADAILMISKGLSERISDMSGLDGFIKMASEKSKGYSMSTTSLLLQFNDLLIATLSFLSYLFLYGARYITVAMYHFSWVFLTLLSPFLLLFHLFSSNLTVALFRSLIEVASWRVVWAILSAILTALPFGHSYQVEGAYITIVIINFLVATCMLITPLVVHSLVGSGFASVAGQVSRSATSMMMAMPSRMKTMNQISRSTLSTARDVVSRMPSPRNFAPTFHAMPQPNNKTQRPFSSSKGVPAHDKH